ncbi:MAG TPA: trehalose-6-phosphate synthase [Mycobacteriales bacterium]|nr:trehalose-6-phosphate synthase [Mycobacteriales bacterium]
MSGARVVIASNRGPLSFRRVEGEITSSRGGGGLVSAMAVAAAQPDALWICAALSDDDREVAAGAPGGRVDEAGFDADGASVRMLDIDAGVLSAAYNSIANSTLWPLNHGLLDGLPAYDEEWRRDWTAYGEYNAAFVSAIAEEAAPGAIVLVQDYHLDLVPAGLREARPDLKISHFTHTPWAKPQDFAGLPEDVARAVISGLLGADSLGFHSPRWAADFGGCAAALGIEVTTPLRAHPLGVDPEPLLARAGEPDVAERRAGLRAAVGDAAVVGRVDRTEPAKNIHRGLLAFAELLRRHPEHVGHVVHLAVAYPSRQDVAEYRDYTALCRDTAARINDELGRDGWKPISLEVRDDYARSLATLAISDVLLVNSMRDGMNLVAKEGVLLSDDAALVLSRETGAADEMTAAMLVDPLDIEGTAEALHDALSMSRKQRAESHAALARVAAALPPREWLQQQIDVLS